MDFSFSCSQYFVLVLSTCGETKHFRGARPFFLCNSLWLNEHFQHLSTSCAQYVYNRNWKGKMHNMLLVSKERGATKKYDSMSHIDLCTELLNMKLRHVLNVRFSALNCSLFFVLFCFFVFFYNEFTYQVKLITRQPRLWPFAKTLVSNVPLAGCIP